MTAMKEIHKIHLLKVSMEIFEQIGTPEQLKAQIGATGIFIDYFGNLKNPGIQFKFPRVNGINCCQIILNNGRGLYALRLLDSRRNSVKNLFIFNDIHCENICSIFETNTGLSLSH
jgi:hypothetical protein